MFKNVQNSVIFFEIFAYYTKSFGKDWKVFLIKKCKRFLSFQAESVMRIKGGTVHLTNHPNIFLLTKTNDN